MKKSNFSTGGQFKYIDLFISLERILVNYFVRLIIQFNSFKNVFVRESGLYFLYFRGIHFNVVE